MLVYVPLNRACPHLAPGVWFPILNELNILAVDALVLALLAGLLVHVELIGSLTVRSVVSNLDKIITTELR